MLVLVPVSAVLIIFLCRKYYRIGSPENFSVARSFFRVTRFNKLMSPYQAILIVLIGVVGIFAFMFFVHVFMWLLSLTGAVTMISGGGGPYFQNLSIEYIIAAVFIFVFMFAFLAIMPSFTEEILVRGVIMPGMERKSKLFAILVTGAMFSIMHMSPLQTVHQFFLGLVFAYIVIETRSLWSAVLLHFVNNFIAVILTVFIMLGGPDILSLPLMPLIGTLIGLPLLVLLLYLLSRSAHNREQKDSPVKTKFKFWARFKTLCVMPRIHGENGEKIKKKPIEIVGEVFAWLFIIGGFAIAGLLWIINFVGMLGMPAIV